MEPVRFNVSRTNLKQLLKNKGPRIIIAIGVANGAEARQLHHTVYNLYAQKAVPDFIGGFIAYISGRPCIAAHR